ncbi:MAG TPA: ATP-binding protein [Fibrobacteria bacterium]|nr:ATP-binding protein [Fibrobacteria bacterium]
MMLDLYRMRRNFHGAQGAITKAIVAKGKHQAMRTGMILATLPENGTSTLIREIIGATVASDPDILYGIYMDTDRKPLAYSRAGDASGGGSGPSAPPPGPLSSSLTDEMSLWASSVRDGSFRSTEAGGEKAIEFAAPVKRGGLILGIVRFGIATKSMDAALHETRRAWRKTKELTISLFGLLGFSTFLMTIWSSSVLAEKITKPIRALTGSAIRIAHGDYRAKIQADGDDEIAVLAEAFETMREKVQDYTGNLQMRVDEKVRQVRDILDNVKQGLFTFNLDLNVNPDCSLSACQILGMDELAGHTLAEVLRLGPQDEALFRDWVDVLRMHYETHRWEKLAKLAPVQELRLGAGTGGKQIKVEYQKILDPDGRLIKIMALIQDVTESRLLESRIWEEKIRLENKVRIILGITSNPPEVVSEFLKESAAKIEVMQKSLPLLGPPTGNGAGKRGGDEGGPEDVIDFPTWIRIMYKDCHTIKGNAGAFGFEVLVELAHELETRLDHAARGKINWPECLPEAQRLVRDMKEEVRRIAEVRLLLSGNSEEVYLRLPESKIAKIRALADKAGSPKLAPELLALVDCCKTISYRSFSSLTRKYRDLVSRVSMKTQKDVAFSVSPPGLELDPEVLLRVDEALVHLVRNAAVYGLDAAEGSGPTGSGSGKIELTYARTSGEHVFTVKDHGAGIDPDVLTRKAVAAGILDREAAEALGEKEKLQLIFYPGFSTSEKPDSLSGRGMGLTIASESVRAWGGTISVASRPGLGSSFTITLPEQGG